MRKVKTGSGATAVQIVDKSGGKYRIVEHLGSARTDAELAVLMRAGRDKLNPGQETLELGIESRPDPTRAVVQSSASRLLVDAIRAAYETLGFGAVEDEAFFQLVLARLVEPTSKADSIRVIDELGIPPVHRNTFTNALKRCGNNDYRDLVARACFAYSVSTTGISLLLYDVTTLYFEAEKEDDYRKVGYSKERRVDPQIVVGLLVDRSGFPLEIHSFQGNKAETHTIVPVIQAFQERHQVADMVVVADAGMLSNMNLQAVDDAGLRFIVGSKQAKAPQDLAAYFRWHGSHHDDGQTVDTITMRTKAADPSRIDKRAEPVWDPEKNNDQWRAVWQYRRKRAVRDRQTLNQQRNRALAIIEGQSRPKTARFVRTTGNTRTFDETSYERAMNLVGWKGYVSNIPARTMAAAELVGSYHDLWHVEQSFRMSKSDLAARPIFHRTKEAIDAHLTIVFTALAVARYLQHKTGLSLKKIINQLKPLREVTINIGGHELTADPQIPEDAAEILQKLGMPG
ncbi:TnpB family transposase [Arthrobacter crystallopoietes BAB-32]|uniref:TnpB family transposase n=1 Tax=Arthrobacter crystallopoietes BAB-32 TaxID=1246476 RepID=N1VCI9_9MICC|nr:TnpB family transposase [Arthrobacter crystallopoietes BAB-32]